MPDLWRILLTLLFLFPFSLAQEIHNHSAPEKLGKVSFPISCAPAVQEQFDRGVALLHSFAYTAAEDAFQGVAKLDPRCAMAHWGMAMTYFHQLWDPPIAPAAVSIAQKEIQLAQLMTAGSERERQFIHALALLYQDAATVPYRTRSLNYEHGMGELASENRKDVEAQVFYALALLATASPSDKTHANQKKAADLLEPIDRILARRECLAPMRRGDGDGHRGLADLEHARAMDDRHLGYRPAGFHLIADLGHYLFGHLGVSLIFEVNDVAPTRKSAGDAAKDDDGAVGVGAHGVLQLDVFDRAVDDLEHAGFSDHRSRVG